jgi:hypothetical protein
MTAESGANMEYKQRNIKLITRFSPGQRLEAENDAFRQFNDAPPSMALRIFMMLKLSGVNQRCK